MKNCNLYIYISSICPWTHLHLPNRTYCLMPIKSFTHKNMRIQSFEHFSNDPRAKGIFVCTMKGVAEDERQFFYDSFSYLKRFLNYLTLYCRHGLKDMDNYYYHDREIDNDLIFDKRKFPPITDVAIAHIYKRHNISDFIKRSLEKADDNRPVNPLNRRIETSMFLYRDSFFQESEGMRHVLRFTALESLTANYDSKFGDKLIREIIEAACQVCSRAKLLNKDINKISSYLGQLKVESIKESIIKTLNEYSITHHGKNIDVDRLYEARNKFVHDGIEIENIHRLSIVTENIIPALIEKLMK
ncbi:MAG: hypothetical protein WBB37_07230 [bacterium]